MLRGALQETLIKSGELLQRVGQSFCQRRDHRSIALHDRLASKGFGNAHERALSEEFSNDMHGTDISKWIYQGNGSTDRPANLGYYVGFKICEEYWRHTEDKGEAIRRILRTTDADAFLRESGYSGGAR